MIIQRRSHSPGGRGDRASIALFFVFGVTACVPAEEDYGPLDACVGTGCAPVNPSNGGRDGGGLPTDAALGPEDCVPAAPGELLINEILFEGTGVQGPEAKFIELVNWTSEPRSVAGIRIIGAVPGSAAGIPADGTTYAHLTAGCLGPHSAVALLPALDPSAAWYSSEAIQELQGTLSPDGLALGDFDVRLVRDTAVIDVFAGPGSLTAAGVSTNRTPDGVGPGLALHTTVSPDGLHVSPGRCANGGTFEAGCMDTSGERPDGGIPPPPPDAAPPPPPPDRDAFVPPPPPPDRDAFVPPPPPPPDAFVPPPPPACARQNPPGVVVNEVLANPAEQDEANNEFVELVNPGNADAVLDGYSIWATNGAGALVERLTLGTATLPAHGGVAIYGNRTPDQWIWSPAPAVMATVAHESFSLVNSANPLQVVLRDAAGVDVSSMELGHPLVKSGISANRCHDVDGTTPVLHDTLGAAASPGLCADGLPFSSGCGN